MDNGLIIGSVGVPALTAALLFAVFRYLYRQGRHAYFRAWQIGWAFYCLSYLFDGWTALQGASPVAVLWSKVALVGVALCVYLSRGLMADSRFHLRWPDYVVGALGFSWAAMVVPLVVAGQPQLRQFGGVAMPVNLEIGMALLLIYCSYGFLRDAIRRGSVALRFLAFAIAFWAVMLLNQLFPVFLPVALRDVGAMLGTLPQMLLAIAMVMVLFEDERHRAQEALLAFSSMDVDFSRVLEPAELRPSLEKLMERLLTLAQADRGALVIFEPFRHVLPSTPVRLAVSSGMELERLCDQASVEQLLAQGALDADGHLHSGVALVGPDAGGNELARFLVSERLAPAMVFPVRSANRCFGAVVVPRAGRTPYGSSQMGLLNSVAVQFGTTIDKYVLMHEAQRRTKEYELLTQIGQVVSSSLNPDDVLQAIHRELGRLFDTATFYVAFLEDDEVRFELEAQEGEVQPKRTRKASNGVTEYVIRHCEPLLVTHNMESVRELLGVVPTGRPARCFCGVPIVVDGRAIGMMAALNHVREYVYSPRDLEVMQTAAKQAAVAIKNSRLFAEEQRRARYFAFLNNISKAAISSQTADEMLPAIVEEIQQNFQFDHIGIGIIDYATKDIEIKAETGTSIRALGKRIPIGVGILGRVARTSEMALVQGNDEQLLGVVPAARSVLTIPISYSETLMGVLNIESLQENAFAPQEVLILRTLADLLATALHNVLVFQKMQQQSITDGLTNIKTRRYFLEAVQAEWKRASRTGRPFSVVLIDLDKFKEVNDSMGHLEGDLVLARIGRLLEQKVRQSNVVARYGGDEFVILMPETSVEQAQILSERLRLWIATDIFLNDRHITGSFGVASYPVHGASVEDIIRIADVGMYVSKHAGGNKVSTAETLTEAETAQQQKQLVQSYVEGFLRREQTGPASAEELVGTLVKLSNAIGGSRSSDALMDAVKTLTRAVETRELHAAGHGESVAAYCQGVARELGLADDEVVDLIFAARVHDVGKIIIPEPILNKATALTGDEYELIKQHAEIGGQIVETIPGAHRAAAFVRHHHERYDGRGYPSGLKGEDIPLGARIIALVESFSNMTADRPYAPLRSHAEAVAEIESLSGSQYDGMLVRLLVRHLERERAMSKGA